MRRMCAATGIRAVIEPRRDCNGRGRTRSSRGRRSRGPTRRHPRPSTIPHRDRPRACPCPVRAWRRRRATPRARSAARACRTRRSFRCPSPPPRARRPRRGSTAPPRPAPGWAGAIPPRRRTGSARGTRPSPRTPTCALSVYRSLAQLCYTRDECGVTSARALGRLVALAAASRFAREM